MNCIIVDNDENNIEVLKGFISKISFLNFLESFNDGVSALNFIKENKVDLVFTEVEIPSVSGIDLIKMVSTEDTMFVFTTSYTHFAIEAFSLGVVDYLVKPLMFHRFLKAITKAKDLYEYKKCFNRYGSYDNTNDFIFVKSEYENIKVNLSEIKYLESLKDYVKIHRVGGKPILTLGSLKSFEERLDKSKFVRVHKSYIVSVNNIHSIQRNRIVIDDMRIPIGLIYKDAFLKLIES